VRIGSTVLLFGSDKHGPVIGVVVVMGFIYPYPAVVVKIIDSIKAQDEIFANLESDNIQDATYAILDDTIEVLVY
jgi:hypothetical protein